MKILKIHIAKFLALFCMLCGMGSCSDPDNVLLPADESVPSKINIGGMVTDDMEVSVTRAVSVSKDAETISWLIDPLENGLDITYGLYGVPQAESHEDVAILQLQKDNYGNIKKQDGLAVYTFKYRADRTAEVGDGNDAIWYNNGYHYFQGVHVPDRIRYTTNPSEVEASDKAPGITTDQHDDAETGTLGNYTLLSHYLGMPANYRLTATVERIKLPFRHRLARVVAFVLIDPELKTTLKGYKKDADGQSADVEDPNTTSIRFCNVQVLQGVKDVEAEGGHHTLTPYWGQKVRKVIPHFDGERGSYSYKEMKEMGGDDEGFKFYYKETDTKSSELYPTSADWKSVHNAADHKGYTEVDYGKVPVYDIIVRPTYTSEEYVMYDEDLDGKTKAQYASAAKNSIDFEIELENGLRYEKHFEFDLNANYQTVVYLRISREHVDYNAAGSDIWLEEKTSDGWYGVNNENGNTLSKAGSSWQRAYTSVTSFFTEVGPTTNPTNGGVYYPNGVTDGQFYNADKNENDNAQYYTAAYDAQWIEKFLQANKKGAHHGDYFILRKPITIDATKIPKDFVFTGHLDGQDNTITLTNVGKPVYKDAETIEQLFIKSGEEYTAWSIPSVLYVKLVTPVYYSSEELAEVDGKTYIITTLEWVAAKDIHYTEEEAEERNAQYRIYVVDRNGKQPTELGYEEILGYKDGYTPITTSDVKETIPGHFKIREDGTSVEATTETVKECVTTYPEATTETAPAYPTTLDQLKTSGVYYMDNQGQTPFVCPALYQYSHNSPAYLFYGLNGVYRTNQEDGQTPWEANVHQEKNSQTMWVPMLGYRAEVLNVRMVSPAMLFMEGAVITGNVQNCYNSSTPSKETAVTHTPNIPQYK